MVGPARTGTTHRTRRAAAAMAVVVAGATAVAAAGVLAAPAGAAPPGVPPSGVGGAVTGWGDDTYGQLDVPSSLSDTTVTAISAGSRHSMALTSGGTVVAWGDDTNGESDVPGALAAKTVTAVAAGSDYSLALTSDGRVTGWGDDTHGVTDIPVSLSGKVVTAIAAGTVHALALTTEGTVIGWGNDQFGELDVPASLTGKTVTAIAAGNLFSVALASDGSVTSWGWDALQQTDVPSSFALGGAATAIAAGTVHTLALTAAGGIAAWGGYDDVGSLDIPPALAGKTVTAVAGGYSFSVALTSDGAVTAWGDDCCGQTEVPPLLQGHATAIDAGTNFVLAITGVRGDFAPPVVAQHPYVSTTTTDRAGTDVFYTPPTAVDAVDGAVPVTCLPAPGTAFVVGYTEVQCFAVDVAGNTGTSTFFVHVRRVQGQLAVTAASPMSGSPAGGTVVTITGHGFTGATRVDFGARHDAQFRVVSDSRITATAPPHAAGFVHVTVTVGVRHARGCLASRYHYRAVSPS